MSTLTLKVFTVVCVFFVGLETRSQDNMEFQSATKLDENSYHSFEKIGIGIPISKFFYSLSPVGYSEKSYAFESYIVYRGKWLLKGSVGIGSIDTEWRDAQYSQRSRFASLTVGMEITRDYYFGLNTYFFNADEKADVFIPASYFEPFEFNLHDVIRRDIFIQPHIKHYKRFKPESRMLLCIEGGFTGLVSNGNESNLRYASGIGTYSFPAYCNFSIEIEL